ncbi:MAG: hypothetical protein HY553_08035, partial [Elusimicrobia bacterium]|nr:hypothetical protein [Elusimicrobiota bacterium]
MPLWIKKTVASFVTFAFLVSGPGGHLTQALAQSVAGSVSGAAASGVSGSAGAAANAGPRASTALPLP